MDRRHQWVDKNQVVLYGHRSIVNQVRYNPQRCLLASSGVEKVIKVRFFMKYLTLDRKSLKRFFKFDLIFL